MKTNKMSLLQVLVTTMNNDGFDLYSRMNLQTDAVIANQSNINNIQETIIKENKIKVVTTNTIGVSKNRNIALNNCCDDGLSIFADDDLVFLDGYENTIIKEFESNPGIEAIKFNLNCISKRKLSMKQIKSFHKLNSFDVSSYGVCGLVIKTKILKEKKLFFNERFGPGTKNYCGEDTIFLQNLIKKKVKLYASPKYIATINQDNSSWFEGHNERYITTAGMVIEECYPFLCYLIVLRSTFKFLKRKDCNLSFKTLLKCYFAGINNNKKEKNAK